MGSEVRLGIDYYPLDLHLDLRCAQDVSSGDEGKSGGRVLGEGRSRIRETDFGET